MIVKDKNLIQKIAKAFYDADSDLKGIWNPDILYLNDKYLELAENAIDAVLQTGSNL
jgi:hypothetical protein